jgi:hypothetical protein
MMTLRNLAVVWGPNLLKDSNASVAQAMIDTEIVTSIVMSLIENVQYLSRDKSAATHKAADGEDGTICDSSSSSSLCSTSSYETITPPTQENRSQPNECQSNQASGCNNSENTNCQDNKAALEDLEGLAAEIKSMEQEIANEEEQLLMHEQNILSMC